MSLLLDTHYVIWLAISPEILTDRELDLLAAHAGETWISAASLWEIKLKWELRHPSGDRKGAISPARALDFARAADFRVEPLYPELFALALDAPSASDDPFDALLLLQAQSLGLRLLTRDRRLVDHPLAYRFG
ncbi:PIN domain-containing protein [Sphingomonas sp. SFZ2018-12]|uniref:type II toxin-antitoxin system VapC family toxin n=1 Tax=Sphingomonas sp. SFZ2018-12 TaxID=2683197 RepID=UPI001F0DDDC4|nr:PIN domain-containing protein [Sphingomonas sp. SFZ2018-12]MCH4892024.1 PIN domain-containing protein [Sphingomonas sp. SFZ2018-12]